MPFVPVPNTVRVFWEHELLSTPGKGWVSHFEFLDGLATPSKMMELGTALVTWWDVHAQPLMTAGTALQRLRMRDLTSQFADVIDFQDGLPLTGTRTGPTMPANQAFCIKLGTGLAGRSNRGRMYWFAMGEPDVTDNFVSIAYANAVQAACQELAQPIAVTLDTAQWSVVSTISEGQPRAEGVVAAIINPIWVDRRVDTQRRRLPKGG